jgi:endoribonuclease Dicer
LPGYPSSLWQLLADLELHSHPVIVGGNLEIRYEVTVAEVGPYGADFYLSTHLRSLVSDLVRKHQYNYMVTQADLRQTDMPQDLEAMSVDSRGSELSSTLIQVETLLEQFGQAVSFEDSFTILPGWLSPKLRVLVSVLMERRSSSFQGIVFVEQRQVAATLAWILPRIPELRGWIATGALIGHGVGRRESSVNQGMVEKKQQETLKAFRAGACNLLISTSVGEEGLDFPVSTIQALGYIFAHQSL